MNTEVRQNYYEILDISENATQQEIHLAYEKAKNTYSIENSALSTVFSSDEARELRNLIEEAYQALQTPPPAEIEKAPLRNIEFENEIANKKDWTGDDLKKVREYRKLSFDELTDITKINPWYIAALEKMDAANLPVEVFVRGYILQVAKALGLKEKTVADSYMRLFRKKIEN